MALMAFGPGALYLTRTDLTAQTPYNIGYVNEFSYDETADTKPLYGQNQYALSVGRSTIKATGKAKMAQISGLALNAAFHGSTFTAGSLQLVSAEAHSVPAVSTYTVTITPPNSGTWNSDLGVLYANTGLPFTKVTSVAAAGQYSVAAGVYTFYSADASASVLISYSYTTSTATQQNKIVTNQLIGVSPTFQLDYAMTYLGAQYYLRFYSCIANKLTQQFKINDFMMPELDFEFFQNAAGQIYEASFTSVS